jgi:hypothetical protein
MIAPEVKAPAPLAGGARGEALRKTELAEHSDLLVHAQVWPELPDIRAMWWRGRRAGARWPAERGVIVIEGGLP